METMQPEQERDEGSLRRLTRRQEDGAIFKVMALIIFAIVGLPIGYGLTRGLTAVPSDLKLIAGFFVFDAGFDLALVVTGHSDMLVDVSPRVIVGKALERIVPVGLLVLIVSLQGNARVELIALYVAWAAGPWLARPRLTALRESPNPLTSIDARP